VATLLDNSTRKLSRDELNQLSRLIDNAKKARSIAMLFLALTTVQATLVLLVAFALAFALRRASAAVRHWMWTLGILPYSCCLSFLSWCRTFP